MSGNLTSYASGRTNNDVHQSLKGVLISPLGLDGAVHCGYNGISAV
jgi:hypothetical protein